MHAEPALGLRYTLANASVAADIGCRADERGHTTRHDYIAITSSISPLHSMLGQLPSEDILKYPVPDISRAPRQDLSLSTLR